MPTCVFICLSVNVEKIRDVIFYFGKITDAYRLGVHAVLRQVLQMYWRFKIRYVLR